VRRKGPADPVVIDAQHRIPVFSVVDAVNRRRQPFAEPAEDGYCHGALLNLGDAVRVPGPADCSVDLCDLF
jgi:hypothetical protein